MAGTGEDLLKSLLDADRLQQLTAFTAKSKKAPAAAPNLAMQKLLFPAGSYGAHVQTQHQFCVMRPPPPRFAPPASPPCSADGSEGADDQPLDLLLCPPVFQPLDFLKPRLLDATPPSEEAQRRRSDEREEEGADSTFLAAAAELRRCLVAGNATACDSTSASLLSGATLDDWRRLWATGGPLDGLQWACSAGGTDESSDLVKPLWPVLRLLLAAVRTRTCADYVLREVLPGMACKESGRGTTREAKEVVCCAVEQSSMPQLSQEEIAMWAGQMREKGMSAGNLEEVMRVLHACRRR